MPSFEGNLLTQRHQIISLETRDSRLSYGENPESLSPGLDSVSGRDRETDRQNRSAVPAGTAVARNKKNVKTFFYIYETCIIPLNPVTVVCRF